MLNDEELLQLEEESDNTIQPAASEPTPWPINSAWIYVEQRTGTGWVDVGLEINGKKHGILASLYTSGGLHVAHQNLKWLINEAYDRGRSEAILESARREKKLEAALEHIVEYWNGDIDSAVDAAEECRTIALEALKKGDHDKEA